VADITHADSLLSHLPEAHTVLADKSFDSDALVEQIEQSGAVAIIPSRSNRNHPRPYDQHRYKTRNLIERFFNRLKQFRRIAIQYEKLARNFSCHDFRRFYLYLVTFIVNLRKCFKTLFFCSI
jgi:Transposase and inactivated derivatives